MTIVGTLVFVVLSGLFFRAIAKQAEKSSAGLRIDMEAIELHLTTFIRHAQWDRLIRVSEMYGDVPSPIMSGLNQLVQKRDQPEEGHQIVETTVEEANMRRNRIQMIPPGLVLVLALYLLVALWLTQSEGGQEGWVIGPIVIGFMWNLYCAWQVVANNIVSIVALREDPMREFMEWLRRSIATAVANDRAMQEKSTNDLAEIDQQIVRIRDYLKR